MMEEGFSYRDRIIWRKPEGYVRIGCRSGVMIRHPHPMYYYPGNLFEEILILQNPEYEHPKAKPPAWTCANSTRTNGTSRCGT
jgi:DNA modification methylase